MVDGDGSMATAMAMAMAMMLWRRWRRRGSIVTVDGDGRESDWSSLTTTDSNGSEYERAERGGEGEPLGGLRPPAGENRRCSPRAVGAQAIRDDEGDPRSGPTEARRRA
jgi:hypothetical protein